MPRRIFIGLTDVAGYFGGLRDGFRSIGIPVTFVDESPDVFRYRTPSIHVLLGRGLAHAGARADRTAAGLVWRAILVVLRVTRALVRSVVFLAAIATCDTFIFTAGLGFFHGRELPVLRLLGKRIIWVFTGTDHRPPYLNGRYLRRAREAGWDDLFRTTRRVRATVDMAERYADVIVAHTASAQFHSRAIVQFLSIGIPSARPRAHAGASVGRPDAAGPLRVVHSPSDPVSKGRDVIRGIVARLPEAGIDVEFVEISGRTHDDVMRALASADLLLNEVYGDTPMGVLATEAAAVGVPAVCGGYYSARVMADAEPGAVPPTTFVLPDELESNVRALLQDDDARRSLGRAARAFVTERWAPEAVARRYLRLMAGDIPAEWTFDPTTSTYIEGWGIESGVRSEAIREYVSAMGTDALCLPRGSAAEGRLLEEIGSR